MSGIYCKHCGTKNEGKVKYCKNCGQEIKRLKFSFFNRLKILRVLIFITVLVCIVIAIIWFISKQKYQFYNSQVSLSVVNILCDNESGGTGTIISSDGYVVTNNHVIAESEICLVTIPNTDNGAPEEIYVAEPIIEPSLSEQYDIAMLRIFMAYEDTNGKVWGEYPKTFIAYQRPSSCGENNPRMGEAVRIYGYPMASGGYNLTITDGIISSFTEYGEILTSAKIDSGNSGGLAVDKNGCILGIPSAVLTGEYENLGVIIPSGTVLEFLDKIPAE